MIKYSIRRQMTAIFIGLFSLILGLVLIINNAFLGHYYLSHKADDLIRTYNDVNAKLESGSLSDSDSVRDILTQLERANVDLVVVDGGGNAILTTLGESDPRLKEMFSGLFGMEGVDHENILKRNEDYTIYRDKSSQVQRDVEYLKNVGKIYGRLMVYHAVSLCEYYGKCISCKPLFDLSRMYRNGYRRSVSMDVFPKYYKTDHGTCRIIPGDGKLKFRYQVYARRHG